MLTSVKHASGGMKAGRLVLAAGQFSLVAAGSGMSPCDTMLADGAWWRFQNRMPPISSTSSNSEVRREVDTASSLWTQAVSVVRSTPVGVGDDAKDASRRLDACSRRAPGSRRRD